MKMTRMPSFDEDLDVSVMSDPRELREELLKSYTYIEKKNHEILNLEEQNLVLREELNHEKQKVIELKRAANTQKEESQKVNGDMEMNQWLTEEVTLLRNSVSEMQEKLGQAVQREEFLKSELADARSQTNKATDIHNEEMGRLSVTVGDQLVQVERELAQRTKELSEATEPFLKHAYGLLVAARKAVQQIESASGRPARQVPQLYDLRSRDLAGSFRSILKLLKYMVEVLAQHTGMPNPFDKQGAGNEEKFSVCDSVSSLASSAQASDLGSQRSALRPPNSGCVAGSQRECGGNKARDDKAARMRSRLSSQYFPGQLQAPDPENTPDKEQLQPEVEVESTSKRWMCYLQD
uniref:Uncharacterized protein n=1 Tax=Alexandrium catenella TaxID=2925 RepID=A0A7S1QL30_ALECA